MLESIKSYISLISVDKNIKDSNYDIALEKLNNLAKEGFRLDETFLKRGKLCHKLLMLDDAYSDFTYIIIHCAKKEKAYIERMFLNFEISNYAEAIHDSNILLKTYPDNFEFKRIKLLSYIYLSQIDTAKNEVLNLYNGNKYRAIQFLFNETAKNIAEDELAKGLKLLEVIELIDPSNPMKILKESNIYGLAGDKEKEKFLLKSIDSVFPKYFISHFRFTDMYEDKNLLEICFLLELKIFDKNNLFAYPMFILEGYKQQMEGHIIDSRECFEKAIECNPNKPEAYVLLAQTYQLMSGYDNSEYRKDAEKNYKQAMEIYQRENLTAKAENMRRQIKHLNSSLTIGR